MKQLVLGKGIVCLAEVEPIINLKGSKQQGCHDWTIRQHCWRKEDHMPRQFRFWDLKRLAASCSCPWGLSVCCRLVCRGFIQGLSWENVFSLSWPKRWNGAQRKISGSTPSTTSWETNGVSFPTIFRRSILPITQKRQLNKKSFLLTS